MLLGVVSGLPAGVAEAAGLVAGHRGGGRRSGGGALVALHQQQATAKGDDGEASGDPCGDASGALAAHGAGGVGALVEVLGDGHGVSLLSQGLLQGDERSRRGVGSNQVLISFVVEAGPEGGEAAKGVT